MRLRSHAKWMYVLLALVFGLSFVFLGVGTGFGGLNDLWQSFASSDGGSSDSSVSDLRERTAKNPRDAAAWRELADALVGENKSDEAVTAYQRYLALRPRDEQALTSLANVFQAKAGRLEAQRQRLQRRAQEIAPASPLPTLTVKNQPVLEPDPITQAALTPIQNRLSKIETDLQAAYQGAYDAYKRLARLDPSDPDTRLSLGQAAERAGDYQAAIAAYRRFAKLAPDHPFAKPAKQRANEIERALRQSSAG
jgi:tetratricopeptide (TPR) repeat protein